MLTYDPRKPAVPAGGGGCRGLQSCPPPHATIIEEMTDKRLENGDKKPGLGMDPGKHTSTFLNNWASAKVVVL